VVEQWSAVVCTVGWWGTSQSRDRYLLQKLRGLPLVVWVSPVVVLIGVGGRGKLASWQGQLTGFLGAGWLNAPPPNRGWGPKTLSEPLGPAGGLGISGGTHGGWGRGLGGEGLEPSGLLPEPRLPLNHVAGAEVLPRPLLALGHGEKDACSPFGWRFF